MFNRDPGVYPHKPPQEEYDKLRAELLHPETLWIVEDNFRKTHRILASNVRQAIDRFDEWAKHENNHHNVATVVSVKSDYSRIIRGKAETMVQTTAQ